MVNSVAEPVIPIHKASNATALKPNVPDRVVMATAAEIAAMLSLRLPEIPTPADSDRAAKWVKRIVRERNGTNQDAMTPPKRTVICPVVVSGRFWPDSRSIASHPVV